MTARKYLVRVTQVIVKTYTIPVEATSKSAAEDIVMSTQAWHVWDAQGEEEDITQCEAHGANWRGYE